MGSYVELLKSCKEGNHKRIKKLLGDCSDIGDVRDLTDKTLLHYCFKFEVCANLILEVAPELLDVGDKNGLTVLHLASMIKPPISLKYLLSKNPDINKRNNDARSSILLAAIYDNYEAVKILCEHKADINLPDNSGVSPLHYAAKVKTDKDLENETKIIDLLLEYNANIECVDFYERSPLMWAVCSNNIVKMNHLIKKGSNIHSKDAGGLSILHYATSNGNLEIIKILLDDYKFNIETVDANSCTALMYACSYNNATVLKFLLEKGANVNAEDCKRRNAVHFACGKGDLKNLEILHQFNANLWRLNNDSNYPLHESAYKGHWEILQFLIDNVDRQQIPHDFINHRNSNGQTALHLATAKDNLKICAILLKNGADPNITLRVSNGKSMTALDLTNKDDTKNLIISYNGKSADDLLKTSVIKEELSISSTEEYTASEEDEDENISSDSDTEIISNEKDPENETKDELMSNEMRNGTELGDTETEKNEIPHQGDLLPEVENNERIIEKVEERRPSGEMNNEVASNKEVFKEELFKDQVMEITEEYQRAILSSCFIGDTDEIISFINKGGSLSNITDQTGKTVLHYSLKNEKCFQLIIEKAPELINKPDLSNLTVLHMAIMLKETDRLQLLLSNNVDFNYSDSNGRTALHLGVLYNNLEALQIMYDHVEDKKKFLHKADEDGNYPLHYSVEICRIKKTVFSCSNFIDLLLKMNGDIECRDNVNRTPLLLAINTKNTEAVSVLLKNGANIMAKDNQNLSSLHYVCSEGILDIFNELTEMETFVPNIEDPNGLTPIFYAISSCNEKIVKRLIELNARLDIIDQYGRNVCHKAAEKGAFKCLELLLSYNVNFWLRSNDGSMPLHVAAYKGYKEIAEILLNTAAASENINVKTNSGQTALHLAAARNDCPMCFLLISKGSNVNEILHNDNENEDMTAYDLATTPYCKETLYTFGGRSAKQIIDCIDGVESEFENNGHLEDLDILRREPLFFAPQPSVRSTELALSTMPSIINTIRTNDVSIDQKFSCAQPVTSPKQSSRKSENSPKKDNSTISSDSSLINDMVYEIIPEKQIPINDNISLIEEKGKSEQSEQSEQLEKLEKSETSEKSEKSKKYEKSESESFKKEPSEKLSNVKSVQDTINSQISEIYKFHKSHASSKTTSARNNHSRAKSVQTYNKINLIDKDIKVKIQSSVLNYEYNRINSKIIQDNVRKKMRIQNMNKLINPKFPKFPKL